MVGRARQAGLLIEPRDVFRHQTLQELALAARTERAMQDAEPEKDLAGSEHPLLPIQVRFFGEDAGDRHHWNQAVLLMPQSRLDWGIVERAVAAVVAHHDALRLRFEEIDGVWRATHDAAPPVSELLWIRSGIRDAAEVTALASAAQASLVIARTAVARGRNGPCRRQSAAPDIGASSCHRRRVVARPAGGLRSGLRSDGAGRGFDRAGAKEPVLCVLGRAPEGACGQRRTGCRTSLLARTQADQADLPCDDDHGDVDRVADGEEILLAFDAGLTTRLLKEAPSAYRTQVNDLLLAALARAVSCWSGIDDVLVELEGHGREDIFAGAEISRTVGWFTTAFPVRLPRGSSDNAALIKAVKEELRAIPARGLGYGVLRYLGTEEQRHALSAVPEPRIVFNYLGQFDASLGEGAPFKVAPESAGAARSASAPLGRWLSINGQVRDGLLRLSFSFGRRRYRRATVERLAERYADALRELVDHCTGGARGITPSDVELSGLSQADLDILCATIDCREIEDIYPLSPMQQGMLFHALRDGESGNYVNQVGLEVRGLDPGRLRAAWQEVSARHAVLRTGFAWRELSGSAQQVVYRHVTLPFVEEDWREQATRMDRSELEAALARASQAERAQGFDLSRAPLQRVRLIRLGEGRHWLIWTHHHILLDGWSSARLVAEILQHERGGRLPAVQGRYRDYIGWLQGQDRDASAAFWRTALADLDEPTFLADALGGPSSTRYDPATVRWICFSPPN